MTADEALALLERTLDTEYLRKVQIDIFREAWNGDSYATISQINTVVFTEVRESHWSDSILRPSS